MEFREVTSATFSDMEKLFESPGGPKYCWCMVWRATPEEATHTDGLNRKAAFAGRVSAGMTVGILGYLNGEAVAWCSIAPRETYNHLGGMDYGSGETVWALACFYLPGNRRRQGIMRQLIAAATDFARVQGATILEAYPVEKDSPSYRFMGFIEAFQSAGFIENGLSGTRRHIHFLRLQ
jgi:GNAT superfamily N-acetyltransferase